MCVHAYICRTPHVCAHIRRPPQNLSLHLHSKKCRAHSRCPAGHGEAHDDVMIHPSLSGAPTPSAPPPGSKFKGAGGCLVPAFHRFLGGSTCSNAFRRFPQCLDAPCLDFRSFGMSVQVNHEVAHLGEVEYR